MNRVSYCSACGDGIADGARYCASCGAQIAEHEASAAKDLVAPPAPSSQTASAVETLLPRQATTDQPRSRLGVAIVLGIVATIALGGGTFALLRNRSEPNKGAVFQEVGKALGEGTPTTVADDSSVIDEAGKELGDAFNRRQAALRANAAPEYSYSKQAAAIFYDHIARIWEQYRSDILDITFPDEAKADVDQLIRDITGEINALDALAADDSHENYTAESAARNAVDGSDRVLANALDLEYL